MSKYDIVVKEVKVTCDCGKSFVEYNVSFNKTLKCPSCKRLFPPELQLIPEVQEILDLSTCVEDLTPLEEYGFKLILEKEC